LFFLYDIELSHYIVTYIDCSFYMILSFHII